jgi:vacuolar-type H+-ATPase subunit B/Vma2|tara:strand:+ start:2991 stop:3203 length:213 start_codon:yes stop_codon:yes gene_type:complete
VKLEEFTDKLATIQADEHLTIETTIDIKQKIVGTKKLWDCSSSELDDILDEYRKEYMKSKNKYSARKDWE